MWKEIKVYRNECVQEPILNEDVSYLEDIFTLNFRENENCKCF